MPCCETCVCVGETFECLSVVDPRFAVLGEWCRSTGDDPATTARRAHSKERSRMGLAHAPQGCGEKRTPGVARQLVNIARVKACPSWEATSACGCGMNRCRAGKGRPEDNAVSYNDCFICLGLLDSKNRDPAP